MMIGAGVGFIVGLITTIFGQKQPEPVHTPARLEGLMGLPASSVSALPRSSSARELKALPKPESRPGESYRFMALSIVSANGSAPKSILLTGIGGNVGCSAAAGQLALALALEGKRTLLIDCDFRAHSLSETFDVKERPGLSDILDKKLLPGGDTDLQFQTAHDNLLFLPAGGNGSLSISDFPNSQIHATLDILNSRADIVLLDTAPCDIVTDAARLAPMVDEVWLVVSATTMEDRVPMAQNILSRSGAKIIKVILTDAAGKAAPFSGK
jgi:tyrosine-protein kinase Etk/Wzc